MGISTARLNILRNKISGLDDLGKSLRYNKLSKLFYLLPQAGGLRNCIASAFSPLKRCYAFFNPGFAVTGEKKAAPAVTGDKMRIQLSNAPFVMTSEKQR